MSARHSRILPTGSATVWAQHWCLTVRPLIFPHKYHDLNTEDAVSYISLDTVVVDSRAVNLDLSRHTDQGDMKQPLSGLARRRISHSRTLRNIPTPAPHSYAW
jgi:hypothetical protein